MVENFNSNDMDRISDITMLSPKQMRVIDEARPINRFIDIAKLETIGMKTYAELFKFYYDIASASPIYEVWNYGKVIDEWYRKAGLHI